MGKKGFFLSICCCLLSQLLQCCFSPVFVNASTGAEEVFRGRPEQGSAWELPIRPSDCDPYTLVCAEGHVGYKNGNHADATLLPAVSGDEGSKKPASCTVNCFRADPVCGLDGTTYWCGAAEAKCEGVEVAHDGYCDIWEGGVGANGLHAAQSLQLVHMVWLVLAGFLIVVGLP
ncbi:unnamed protein product [Sphagnum jensenii]|uniref:Kazal-like domain-containing protein n=1 Tax=Sphagnum jensenii TaxID=128206 RepID=A0ABP1BJR8_9BRYO